jgi:hypothetical protein
MHQPVSLLLGKPAELSILDFREPSTYTYPLRLGGMQIECTAWIQSRVVSDRTPRHSTHGFNTDKHNLTATAYISACGTASVD